MKIKACLFFVYAMFLISGSAQTTYYFSSSQGNDTNNGLTPERPKKTLAALQDLLLSAKPGDKYLLRREDTWIQRAGTYALYFEGVHATAQNPVVIGAYGTGEKPKLDISGTSPIIKFFSGSTNLNSSYIIIRDLQLVSTASITLRPEYAIQLAASGDPATSTRHITISNCIIDGTQVGIYIPLNCHYTTVDRCLIQNTIGGEGGGSAKGGEAIVGATYNQVITNNTFLNCGWGDEPQGRYHIIYLTGGGKNIVVANNIFGDSPQGISVVNGDSIQFYDNYFYNLPYSALHLSSRANGSGNLVYLTNVFIERNSFENCPEAIRINKSVNNLEDRGDTYDLVGRIANNIILNSTYGIRFFCGVKDELYFDDWLLANNTIVNSQFGIQFTSNNVTYKNMKVYNNILYNTKYSSGALLNIFDESDLSQIDIDYDLYYSTTGYDTKVGNTTRSVDQFKNFYSALEQNSISGNPLFVNINSNDVRLSTESSPAVDKGIDLRNMGINKDRDSKSRPALNGFDIGAFEFGATGEDSPELNIKIFLEGPYSSGSMSAGINGSLPLHQPYDSTPWNYNGLESVSSIPSGVVDWVLLELRTGITSSTLVSRRAAFIKTDGRVVDLDGTSPVGFNGVSQGSYYVVVRHRNHLPVMSSDAVSLNSNSPIYDFTISSSKAYGIGALTDLGDGKWGMIAGDGDLNNVVNDSDYSVVGNHLFEIGYQYGDFDMNGIVNVIDYAQTNKNLLKTSKVPY